MTTTDGAQASPVTGELLIDAVIAPKLSFATHQDDVPALRELKLVNLGEAALECIVLSVTADPPVFAPREWRFDRVAGGVRCMSRNATCRSTPRCCSGWARRCARR